jgi:hypothetical protein
MRLCQRHVRDEGTAIRVWDRHVGWHPNTAITSRHQTTCRRRRHAHGGKTCEKSAHTGSVSLDKKRPHKG